MQKMLNLEDIPLHDASFPWFVVGGWALDLFLGRQTRPHADIDLGIIRCDQLALQEHLVGWSLHKIVDGALVSWKHGEYISLPVHEIHAQNGSGHEFELLLLESDNQNWVYRRNASINRPLKSAILEVSLGLKVLAPEIVLLFKSKNSREQDLTDLENLLPALSAEQKQWLLTSIKFVCVSHSWVSRLSI